MFIPLISGVTNILMHLECRDILKLIAEQRYSEVWPWIVIGFITGVALGTLLKAYIKLGEMLTS